MGDLLSAFDRTLLVDLLAVVDAEIAKLNDLIDRDPDPDGSGLLDRGESLCGLLLDPIFDTKGDYPLSNLLHELMGKPATLQLSDLISWLEKWRQGLNST